MSLKVIVSVLLLLCCVSCQASDDLSGKIIGVWECEPFVIKNEYFVVDGSGSMSFDKNRRVVTAYRYEYKLFDESEIAVDFEVAGNWKWGDGLLEDSIDQLSIKKIENSSAIPESDVEAMVKSGFVFNKPSKSKIRFTSDDELFLDKESKSVKCLRKTVQK